MSAAATMAEKIHKHAPKGTLFGKPRGEVVKHPGSFKKAAKKHGESTHEFAESKKGASGVEGKRARLALIFEKMRAKKGN